MTTTPKLTKAQQAAMDKLRAGGDLDGALHPYHGVITSTVRALEHLGLVTVEWGEPAHSYRTMRPAGQLHRGGWSRNWTCRLRGGS